MKKILTLCAILIYIAVIGSYAQTLVSTDPQNRNVVLEEYTGIHCGFCPQGHAIAQSLSDKNLYRVVIVNVHAGGYAEPSAGEPDYRTVFGEALDQQASVKGYPAGSINRHLFADKTQQGGTAMGRGDWEAAANEVLAQVSPLNVGMKSEFNAGTRELTVTVELYYTENSAASSNFINVALLENDIIGPQTGTSGNYNHKHMLRWFLTGQWGDQVTTTTKGTFVTRTYSYTVPTTFNVDNCDVAAYVAESHQEIITGTVVKAVGGTTLLIGNLASESPKIESGIPSGKTTYNLKAKSELPGSEQFQFTLITNAPQGWQVSFSVGGTDYQNTAVVALDNTALTDVKINVTPDNTAYIADFELLMASVNNPDAREQIQKFNLISGVTDLIVNNNASLGDNSDINAKNWELNYINGLNAAGNTSFTSTMANTFVEIGEADKLGGVKNIYYNVGWTFPAFSDEFAQVLGPLLDAGVNLFISGQDIAWDVNAATTDGAHGTVVTKQFFNDYFHATFIADGNATNNMYIANTDDVIFNTVANSALENVYGSNSDGTPFMYPDQIIPNDGSMIIFYYDANKTKVGGIRSSRQPYKMVYIAVSLEMISDVSVRNQIVKLSHDWFYNTTSAEEFDKAMRDAIGNNYPNPCNEYTTIPLGNVNKNLNVKIYDLLGNIVFSEIAPAGRSEFRINTKNFNSGIYICRFFDGDTILGQMLLNVTH